MTHITLKRRRFRPLLIGVFVAFGICLAAIGYRFNRTRNDLPELRTVKFEQRDLVVTVGSTGTIEPPDVVQVGPDVAGKIVKFGFDLEDSSKAIGVGSRVRKDTVLFQIDTVQYEIGLNRATSAYRLAEADLSRLNALLNQARRSLDRANRLRDTNAQSSLDEVVTAHEMAVANLAVGQARLEQARNELKHAEISLANTSVRSPIDGVVIDRRAIVGQHVHIGHPGLFLLAKDLEHMRIRASVSESDIGKIHMGQSVTFSIDSVRDRVLTGRVEQIMLNARTQGNFVTYDVLVGIDPTEVPLMPHMTADVQFEVVRRDRAWLVPSAALHWQPSESQLLSNALPSDPPSLAKKENLKEGDIARVWIPAGEGKVRAVTVKVGIDDGVLTQVVGKGFRKELPVVVGVVKRTALSRIIPTAKTIR